MNRVNDVLKNWAGTTGDEIALDFQDRHRRRIVLTSKGGMEFILDLGDVPDLREGDALRLASGDVVAVRAAPEALMEIVCSDPLHLARIAWHLGNRHLATEIDMGSQTLRIHADHVIADMVQGLGGEVCAVSAAFNPEGGAYGQAANAGQSDGHGHHHHDDHDDDHGDEHGYHHDYGHKHAHHHG
ncbi:MAG: urease accessory protein UreE [Parvibaculaceae bacterium]